jgi:hypothetical protein
MRRTVLLTVLLLASVPALAQARDTTPPTTRITNKLAGSTTSTSASFSFRGRDNRRVKGFQCSLDSAAWTRCSSPKSYTRLAVGTHRFRVRAFDAARNKDRTPATRKWSIRPPAATPPSATPPAPAPQMIVGANGAANHGAAHASQVLRDGIKSARIDLGRDAAGTATSYGFRSIIAIVGNTPDGTPLEDVDQAAWLTEATRQLKEGLAAGITLFEVMNEPYDKGTGGSRPDIYAKLYASLRRQNLGGTLLFPAFGDYYTGATGRWSQDANGGGWLTDAIAAEPDLKSLVDGFSFHAYGPVGYNYADRSGPGALEALHSLATQLGFPKTDFYVPETGFHIGGPNEATYVPDAAAQATSYKDLLDRLASLAWVKGVWAYQINDDGTGNWGLISTNSPWTPRPAYQVLVDFSKRHGG